MLPGHKEVSKSILGLISHFSFLHNFVTFLSCFSNSASFASILHEYKALWMLETRQEKDQVLSFNPCATVGLHTDQKICQKKKSKNRLFSLIFGQVRHMDLGILGKKTKMKMKVRFLSQSNLKGKNRQKFGKMGGAKKIFWPPASQKRF